MLAEPPLECSATQYCFIVDTSTSVDQAEMLLQKAFLKTMVTELDQATAPGQSSRVSVQHA